MMVGHNGESLNKRYILRHMIFDVWVKDMKHRVVQLQLISTLLLSTMIIAAASAQQRTVGVTEGSWFNYEIEVNWNSNDPDAVFPPLEFEDMEIINATEWATMMITGVSGTNVSVQYLTHYKNGTEEIEDGYIDVDTGDGVNATLTIIAANLGANDNIYTSGDYSTFTINETTTKMYPDGTRNLNYINMTYEYSWTIEETDHYFVQSTNLYWDKETGVIVENSLEIHNQTGDYLTTWSIVSRLADSSVWTIPEFPAYSSMVIIGIIATVSAIPIEQRLTKKQPNKSK